MISISVQEGIGEGTAQNYFLSHFYYSWNNVVKFIDHGGDVNQETVNMDMMKSLQDRMTYQIRWDAVHGCVSQRLTKIKKKRMVDKIILIVSNKKYPSHSLSLFNGKIKM